MPSCARSRNRFEPAFFRSGHGACHPNDSFCHSPHDAARPPHRHSPLEIQDLAGPLEVFSRTDGYHVEVASPFPDGRMGINAGLTVGGGLFYKKVTGAVDTLWLVPALLLRADPFEMR